MNFDAKIWLFILPFAVLLLLLGYWRSARLRNRRLRRFASPRLLDNLMISFSPVLRRVKDALILCGFISIFLALAGPRWGYDWQEIKSRGIDILFALDTSKSMLAEDVRPSRLERARWAILDLLEKLKGDRVGLIAFAGQAFLECPLTLDYDAFRQSLEAVDPDIIALGGTDIASAISEAEVTFDQNDNHKILVLITDGEDLGNEGIRRARAAAESGVTIYTVGVGSSSGELIPIRQPDDSIDYLRDDRGNVVKTRLDEQTLLALAKVTDGFYVPLGATGDGLEQVYKNGLSRIPKEETRSQMKKVAISRFQWPLVIALVLLFIEPLIGNRRFQKRAESDLDNRAAKSLKYR